MKLQGKRRDVIKENRPAYLHLYFSPERDLEDEKAFNSRMVNLQEELESGQRHPDHEKYFKIKSTPVKGVIVTAREEVMAAAKRDYGYFALLSNDIKESWKALEIYRNKDLVETPCVRIVVRWIGLTFLTFQGRKRPLKT